VARVARKIGIGLTNGPKTIGVLIR
jgi:hypothetical protein